MPARNTNTHTHTHTHTHTNGRIELRKCSKEYSYIGGKGCEKEEKKLSPEIEETEKTRARRSRSGNATEEELLSLDRQVEALEEKRAAVEASIPAEWDAAQQRFTELSDAKSKALRNYRNNVDGAYKAVAELRGLISQAEALGAVADEMRALDVPITDYQPEEAMASIKVVEDMLGELDGASAIKSRLSKARRALKGDDPDREEATALLGEALELHAAEYDWRRQAATELEGSLEAYDESIGQSIGLRLQPRLTKEQAKFIARCQSVHRDISLNF